MQTEDLAPGILIADRYRLDQPIGRGAAADVWAATDTILERPVALKVLRPELGGIGDPERFRVEALAAAKLSHPAIVGIFDVCEHGRRPALVLERVAGTTLADYIAREAPAPLPVVVGIVSRIADALHAAHEAGIVHRDVKPANILLGTAGEVKLTDFGIAHWRGRSDPGDEGPPLGTDDYVAPEQRAGHTADRRADVHALAVVTHELLTGRLPRPGPGGPSVDLDRDDVPLAVADVLARALANDPDHRPATALELRVALEAAATAPPAPSVPEDDAGFVRTERRWLLLTGLVVAVGAALVVAGLLFAGPDGARELVGAGDPAAGDDTVADPDVTDDPAPPSPAAAVPLAVGLTAVAFDPSGGDGEHDDEAPFAVDGDPTTAWRTEGYLDRDLDKDGVGIVVSTDEAHEIRGVRVDTESAGWSAVVYVADSPAADVDGWGTALGSVTDSRPDTDIAITPTTGRHVLLWFVDLGPEGPPHRAVLHEIELLGRPADSS